MQTHAFQACFFSLWGYKCTNLPQNKLVYYFRLHGKATLCSSVKMPIKNSGILPTWPLSCFEKWVTKRSGLNGALSKPRLTSVAALRSNASRFQQRHWSRGLWSLFCSLVTIQGAANCLVSDCNLTSKSLLWSLRMACFTVPAAIEVRDGIF